MSISPRFVVVDDDKFNNALCRMVISKICPDAEILTFHDPTAGFDFVTKEFPNFTLQQPVVLFLDINMPGMDGWQFLEKLNQFLSTHNQVIAGRLIIYVLSSSVDRKDIDKAVQYSNVVNYIIKPITKDAISKLLEHITGN